MKNLSDLKRGLHRASVRMVKELGGLPALVTLSVAGVGDVLVDYRSVPTWIAEGMHVSILVEDPAKVLVGRAIMNAPPKISWRRLPC